ncbi:MAG: hypothetical protein ACTHUY_09850 [Flaviflexus sp.]|uniref:hypothetical protein n=1 Tax=Flaviflexus sp. TaxID=1969482 RepID=UPI003F90EC9E
MQVLQRASYGQPSLILSWDSSLGPDARCLATGFTDYPAQAHNRADVHHPA